MLWFITWALVPHGRHWRSSNVKPKGHRIKAGIGTVVTWNPSDLHHYCANICCVAQGKHIVCIWLFYSVELQWLVCIKLLCQYLTATPVSKYWHALLCHLAYTVELSDNKHVGTQTFFIGRLILYNNYQYSLSFWGETITKHLHKWLWLRK